GAIQQTVECQVRCGLGMCQIGGQPTQESAYAPGQTEVHDRPGHRSHPTEAEPALVIPEGKAEESKDGSCQDGSEQRHLGPQTVVMSSHALVVIKHSELVEGG